MREALEVPSTVQRLPLWIRGIVRRLLVWGLSLWLTCYGLLALDRGTNGGAGARVSER